MSRGLLNVIRFVIIYGIYNHNEYIKADRVIGFGNGGKK